ncbi:hypothetical protein FRX31_019039 [Thalictrum thalictroides]|uniref:Uncharacterized protein n=1 Tax=Thalictrum thalictroides TaxID=46969 RepID=A0A7J6W3K8_THATH|nr:hypothetical protein FRX31_019039 [Thalictrum thalictroides]
MCLRVTTVWNFGLNLNEIKTPSLLLELCNTSFILPSWFFQASSFNIRYLHFRIFVENSEYTSLALLDRYL